MFWRRCPRCGRLTLSRIGVETPCDCVTGAARGAAEGGSFPTPRPQPAASPEAGFPGFTPALPASAPVPALPPLSTPAPAPRLALLTPEQDAAARRLLASVFPNGFDF
jgi:hypothetical protein